MHGREACPTFVHPCTSTRESLFLVLCIGVMCVLTCVSHIVQELQRTCGSDQLQEADSSRIKVYARKIRALTRHCGGRVIWAFTLRCIVSQYFIFHP